MFQDNHWDVRTRLLLGDDAVEKLKKSSVCVAGIGGVGGTAAEQLARAGIGRFLLIDNDTVHISNLNRQMVALHSSIDLPKVEVMKKRILDINPEAQIETCREFLSSDNIYNIIPKDIDYVIDAIDSLTPKVELMAHCYQNNLSIISAMGAGGKKDPTKVELADIEDTHHCRLSAFVRKYLHRKGIRNGLEVVFSSEVVPKEAVERIRINDMDQTVVGTISYMPAIFGMMCASVVIKKLIDN